MERSFVSSTNLTSVGYEPSTETLEIKFRSGGIYQYFNVPPESYQALMNASSKGSYHAAHIKNRYPYRKVH